MKRRLSAVALLAGCMPSGGPIVDMMVWEEAAEDLPFFEGHNDSVLPCEVTGWGPELGGLEVDTGLCPYANLVQPSLRRVREGERLQVIWFHQGLAALEPSEGHIALATEKGILWEAFVPIPSDPKSYQDMFDARFDLEAGEPIYLHLHNHGANTWNLLEVSEPTGGEEE